MPKDRVTKQNKTKQGKLMKKMAEEGARTIPAFRAGASGPNEEA
jgi:hypothetical protein